MSCWPGGAGGAGSGEVCVRLAKLLRPRVTSQHGLHRVEALLRVGG